jgi:pilus assembly protein CpaC
MTHSNKIMAKALTTAALTAALLIQPVGGMIARAADAPAGESAIAQARTEVTVTAGKSTVVELPSNYADLMISDHKVADVMPLGPRSVYVIGHALGATSLMAYGPGKRLIAAFDVAVVADADGLKKRLSEVLPSEKGVSVRTANQSIVLSGVVGSAAAMQQVLSLAESYAPGKVINMMGVEGSQQVMMSVRFVEMKRTLAKELDLNVQSRLNPAGKSPFNFVTGDQFNGNSNLLQSLFGAGAARLGRGAGAVNVMFDALETRGLVKTLAEPNLVAMSGDTASFLAGGEFPIPVQQSSGTGGSAPTITVQFKQFGVSLAFTPTILQDGLINLVVKPEVSEIDPTTSFTVGTIQVPGLKVRRANTTVELRDGESFTIAGLLQDNYNTQIRQYPFVGDLPVLGALFRSNGFQRSETELVIVVTARTVVAHRGPTATPADRFTPPSDLELFLLGNQQATRTAAEALGLEMFLHGNPQATRNRNEALDRVLIGVDPRKGGIDGPHGHVIY